MKIVFDNIIYFLQNSGGGSVYWTELIKYFTKSDEDLCFIEQRRNTSNIFRNKLRLKTVIPEKNLPLIFTRYLPLTVVIDSEYIFHSSCYRISLSKKAINFTTVYDFTAEFYFKGISKYVNYFQKWYALRNSQGIICISRNTKEDLIKIHPWIDESKVRVIYCGVGKEFFKIDKEQNELLGNQFKFLQNKKFVLYVGHRTKYKNFDVAVDTISLLSFEYYLVIVGVQLTEKEKTILDSKIGGRYYVLCGINSSDLNIIYNNAFCLIYPSSYEGFGIPLLEAMKAGCPVITTNKSSIPEVVENAAIMIDEIKPEKFREAIVSLENDQHREEMINKGYYQAKKFSWEKCGEEVKRFYYEICDGRIIKR